MYIPKGIVIINDSSILLVKFRKAVYKYIKEKEATKENLVRLKLLIKHDKGICFYTENMGDDGEKGLAFIDKMYKEISKFMLSSFLDDNKIPNDIDDILFNELFKLEPYKDVYGFEDCE